LGGACREKKCFQEKSEGKRTLENLDMDRRIRVTLKCILIEWEYRMCFFMWLRKGNGSGLHKLQRISWPGE
jgi:hypothetical protein